MTSRWRILQALDIQEEIEGLTPDLKRLRKFLDCCRTANQWQAFVNVKHHSYGKYSYQCHLFYYSTPELRKMINGI